MSKLDKFALLQKGKEKEKKLIPSSNEGIAPTERAQEKIKVEDSASEKKEVESVEKEGMSNLTSVQIQEVTKKQLEQLAKKFNLPMTGIIDKITKNYKP